MPLVLARLRARRIPAIALRPCLTRSSSSTRLSYRYPGAAGPALREVDLRIDAGEMVARRRAARGRGSRRSCALACGLVPHFHGGDVAGAARICGLDLAEHGPAELGPLVGMVAQEPETQVVSATVRAELELPLEIRGEPQAARARAVEEVALALGIERLLGPPDRSPSRAASSSASRSRRPWSAGRG